MSLLSPHFSLHELTRTAIRDIDNRPGAPEIFNLTRLCTWILEPLRARFGPLHVNSGYRCEELNTRIGGTKNSAHIYGCAADIEPVDENVSIDEIMAWLAQDALPFDQAIDEHGRYSDWLHIATVRPGYISNPRRELLVMSGGKYSPWTL